MCFLVRSEILGLFVNTLTADDKYPGQNRESVQESMKIKLSGKLTKFSSSFD